MGFLELAGTHVAFSHARKEGIGAAATSQSAPKLEWDKGIEGDESRRLRILASRCVRRLSKNVC